MKFQKTLDKTIKTIKKKIKKKRKRKRGVYNPQPDRHFNHCAVKLFLRIRVIHECNICRWESLPHHS